MGELKSNLEKGDKIKIKIKGKIIDAIVVSVNPKRVRVEVPDGKHWYVPYQYIV